jgi:hypothetical protein
MTFPSHQHKNSDSCVFEIPKRVWYAAKLRLYLTSYGVCTNIKENGYIVGVEIDHETKIICLIANEQHPNSVKLVISENGSRDDENVVIISTFARVLAYIRFMELVAGSHMTPYQKNQACIHQLNAPIPPKLVYE